MKKLLLYLTLSILSTAITLEVKCQLLYNSSNIGTRIYNPGFGANNTPVILFDDINFPSSVVGINDSVIINKFQVAIGRAPGAPAVTVNVYASIVNPASTDTLPVIPAKMVGTLDLPAGGNSNIFTVGDGITPLFTFAADTGLVTAGYQTLFIGLSFSDSAQSNGWYLSTGPDSNFYTAFKYDASATDSVRSFNFYGSYNLPATFYTQVYGTVKLASPLPITLKSFTVNKGGQQNILAWNTETENNSSYFIIQRSTDGHNFTKIGVVKAAGKSTSLLNYSFADDAPVAGTNYYRLYALNKDNSGAYSIIRSVRNAIKLLWNIYPNPVVGNLSLTIDADKAGKATVSVTDFNGRQVLNHIFEFTSGNNAFGLDMSKFAKGDYILKAQTTDDSFIKKFTKK